MLKFDPTKPHGTIHGASDLRRFEQNGCFFDSEGNEFVPVDLTALDFSAPRKRTRAEEEQYQKDVADAAALMAAKK